MSNFSFGWNGDCNIYVAAQKDGERDRERRPVRCEEIMLVMIQELCFVSEPVETKYLKFELLIVLGSSGIQQLANWEE